MLDRNPSVLEDWGGYEHIFENTNKDVLARFKDHSGYDIDLDTLTCSVNWRYLEENLQEFGVLYPVASITINTLYNDTLMKVTKLHKGSVTVEYV